MSMTILVNKDCSTISFSFLYGTRKNDEQQMDDAPGHRGFPDISLRGNGLSIIFSMKMTLEP